MLALYISEVLGPNNSLVFSAQNPSPISFPDLTFSDTVASQIFIVNGSGGYSTASGASGSTVVMSIGELDIAVWSNNSWSLIAGPPAGWVGGISPSGDDLFNLFQGRDEMVLKLQIKVTDQLGNSRTYLSMPVRILNSMAPANNAIASITDGQFAIASGVDSVTVSGLALQAVPRRVLVNIQKPNGGSNIFGTVRESSITSDGFIVDLSAATDATGYLVVYQLTFGS